MLVRMVTTIDRWDGTKKVKRPDGLFIGDAVTDIKTRYNELSVWYIADLGEINDVLVALALGRMEIKKLCYILLDELDLKRIEIDIENEKPGEASGMIDTDILNRHRDMVDLDFWRIGYLVEYMYQRVDAHFSNMISKKTIGNLILNYIDQGKISEDLLNSGIKKDLERLKRM